MVHLFGTTLGHGTGGFLTGTTTDTGQTITGQSVSPQVAQSVSFTTSLQTLQNILSGVGLPSTQREALVTSNLVGLGQASVDISKALGEQIDIREEQRAIDNANTQELFSFSLERFGEISQTLGSLGDSVKNAQAAADQGNFLESLTSGLGVSLPLIGAAVLGIILLK